MKTTKLFSSVEGRTSFTNALKEFSDFGSIESTSSSIPSLCPNKLGFMMKINNPLENLSIIIDSAEISISFSDILLNDDISFSKLYDSDTSGFDYDAFASSCLDVNGILILFQSHCGSIFGFSTPLCFSASSKAKNYHPDSFVFSLKNPNKKATLALSGRPSP